MRPGTRSGAVSFHGVDCSRPRSLTQVSRSAGWRCDPLACRIDMMPSDVPSPRLVRLPLLAGWPSISASRCGSTRWRNGGCSVARYRAWYPPRRLVPLSNAHRSDESVDPEVGLNLLLLREEIIRRVAPDFPLFHPFIKMTIYSTS